MHEAAGIPVKTLFKEGHIVQEITKTAMEDRFDLMFICLPCSSVYEARKRAAKMLRDRCCEPAPVSHRAFNCQICEVTKKIRCLGQGE